MTNPNTDSADSRQIAEAFDDAIRKNYGCEVTGVTYLGTNHPDGRPDKRIHILLAQDARGDDIVVMVGDKGKRGPSLLKVGTPADTKNYKSQAYFSLKGAGFPKKDTRTQARSFKSADSLWVCCFDGHHGDSLAAKRAFLQLIGVEVGSSFDALMEKASAKRVDPPKKPDPAEAYAGNPLYGLL